MRRTQTNTFLLHQSLINHQEEEEQEAKGGDQREEKTAKKKKKKKDRFFLSFFFFPSFVLLYVLHAHYILVIQQAYHLLGEKNVRFFLLLYSFIVGKQLDVS